MQKEGMKKAINILTVLCTAAMAAFVIYGVKSGIFTDRAMMEELVRKGGIWAPVTFILIQMVQVVVPIIPGGITCAVGVVIFGPWYGLLYNYNCGRFRNQFLFGKKIWTMPGEIFCEGRNL